MNVGARQEDGYLDSSMNVAAALSIALLRKSRMLRKRRSLMTSIATAASVSKSFGSYQDAAVRAPVIITKNGRPRTVLLAYEDYLRLARRDRRVDLTADLPEAEIIAVENAEMAAGFEHLNSEMANGGHAAR
jgi:prevent-host-death family protein